MKIIKFIIPIAILLIGFFVMQALSRFGEDEPRQAPPPATKIVEARVVELAEVRSRIVAYGRLASEQPVQLYSEVAGELQPGAVAFLPGQTFKKGAVLLEIDDRQARLNVNSAKSELLNALASVLPEIKVDFPIEYEIWQRYFDSTSFDRELAELPAAGNPKIKLFLSRFDVYKLYFNARNLEILLDKHFITAPFDGEILATDLRAGSTTRVGTRLGEIINLEKLEVELPVQTQELQWLDRSVPVKLTSSELAGEWTGRITRVGGYIDDRTQTAPVFVTLGGKRRSGLYNGLFLRAEIIGKPIGDAAVIPQSAIYEERNVYLVKNGRLHYQTVDIARKETETVIVDGGLAAGDTLVVSILQGVAPGMKAQANIIASNDEAQP